MAEVLLESVPTEGQKPPICSVAVVDDANSRNCAGAGWPQLRG